MHFSSSLFVGLRDSSTYKLFSISSDVMTLWIIFTLWSTSKVAIWII